MIRRYCISIALGFVALVVAISSLELRDPEAAGIAIFLSIAAAALFVITVFWGDRMVDACRKARPKVDKANGEHDE